MVLEKDASPSFFCRVFCNNFYLQKDRIETVKFQLKRRNIDSLSLEHFTDYWRNLGGS